MDASRVPFFTLAIARRLRERGRPGDAAAAAHTERRLNSASGARHGYPSAGEDDVSGHAAPYWRPTGLVSWRLAP